MKPILLVLCILLSNNKTVVPEEFISHYYPEDISQVSENSSKSYVIIKNVKWATRNLQTKSRFTSAKEQFGGYFINQANLCPEGWRLPTKNEFNTLITSGGTWEVINGIKGRWYGGNHSTDKKGSIFLPAAGAKDSDGYYSQNEEGYYWTSTKAFLDGRDYGYFYCLVFPNDVINKYNQNSLSSIRCVMK